MKIPDSVWINFLALVAYLKYGLKSRALWSHKWLQVSKSQRTKMWYIIFISLLLLRFCLLVNPLWSYSDLLFDMSYNEVTQWLSCDQHLETPLWNNHNNCFVIVMDKSPIDITVKLPDDLSQSNGHGDFRVEFPNDNHMQCLITGIGRGHARPSPSPQN